MLPIHWYVFVTAPIMAVLAIYLVLRSVPFVVRAYVFVRIFSIVFFGHLIVLLANMVMDLAHRVAHGAARAVLREDPISSLGCEVCEEAELRESVAAAEAEGWEVTEWPAEAVRFVHEYNGDGKFSRHAIG